MIFQVEGKLRMGSEERQFSKTIEAKSENDARNRVLAEFGSKNGLPRSAIRIEKISKA